MPYTLNTNYVVKTQHKLNTCLYSFKNNGGTKIANEEENYYVIKQHNRTTQTEEMKLIRSAGGYPSLIFLLAFRPKLGCDLLFHAVSVSHITTHHSR